MLTEDEAKTKRCCGGEGCGIVKHEYEPRQGEPTLNSFTVAVRRCIGSACMAWKWGMPQAHACDEKPEFGYRERGFCGLACKP